MAITTKTADQALKSYYLSAVARQLDTGVNPLLAQFRKTTENVYGKDVKKVILTGLSPSFVAGTEDGTLPSSAGSSYATFTTTLKNLYGTIEISDKAIRASASNDGAFVNLLNSEMESVLKSATFNFGRMLFGDGTGALGTIASGSDNSYIVDKIENFAVGMPVDLYNGSSLISSSLAVKSIDLDTKRVILTSMTSGAAGYKFYAHSSKGNEITGLQTIFESSEIYGLSRSSYPALVPYKMKAETLTETAIQTVIDKVEANSGSKINFIVCSWGVRRALIELLSKSRQLQPMELEGGFKALSYNGIPVVADRFCPSGTMYLLNTDDFAIHQLCDWQWLEGEDGSILKQVPGKPVYQATLVKYAELMCYRPAGQGKIYGITEV